MYFFSRQMIVLEFKAQGKTIQYAAIDEAIRTAQFVRNKCIRHWMDNRGVGQKELYRHNTKSLAPLRLLTSSILRRLTSPQSFFFRWLLTNLKMPSASS